MRIIVTAAACLLLASGAWGQNASAGALAQNAPAAAKSCQELTQLELSKAKIVSVQAVEAGAFTPPPQPPLG